MPTLPSDPFVLHGSCFCQAITYTLSLPALASRPLLDFKSKNSIGLQTETDSHLPIMTIDHCNTCRRIAGSILQCWLILPFSWASFSLLLRSDASSTERIEASAKDCVILSQSLLEKTHIRYFQSSEDRHRTFCGRCGTHLTFFAGKEGEKWGGHFDVTVGSLEKESVEMVVAGRQGWVVDGIEWVKKLVRVGIRGFDFVEEEPLEVEKEKS